MVLDRERLPALVQSLPAMQAYVDAQIPFERYLARVAMENARRFRIRLMPHLFVGRGLMNGPRIIPAHTIVAVYYSVLCQVDARDEHSAYVMVYGKMPDSISRREFVLDGKPRLGVCPDSNGSYVNHKCYHANAEFVWVGDPPIYRVARTRRPIQPFEQITVSYGEGYLISKAKARRIPPEERYDCLCEAPGPCPLRRSMPK